MSDRNGRLKQIERELEELKQKAQAGPNENIGLALKTELGLLGKFFGSGQYAPFYIAGFVAVLALIAVIALLFVGKTEGAELVVSIILAAFGYVLGRGARG